MKEIEERRSIRKYKEKPITNEVLEDIIKQAMLAPSGSNTQPWQYLIISDKKKIADLAKINNNQEWIAKAPHIIVGIANGKSRFVDNDIVIDDMTPDLDVKRIIRDTSISMAYLQLAAQERKLGTTWLAWYDQNELKDYLNLPSYTYVVGIMTIGYPDEKPTPRPRKKLNEVLFFDEYPK